MTNQGGFYSGPTMSPPHTRGVMPAQPTSWPHVLGIIGVVISILGILNGLWGAVSPWVMEKFAAAMPQTDVHQAEMMSQWKYWIAGSSAFGLLLAIILLVGSVQLLKRRRSSRATIISWSILKIILAAAASVLVYRMYEDQMEAIKKNPDTAQAPTGLLDVLGPIAAGFNFAWYVALPVFMLIWFNRKKIKAETSGWN